jgi:hypothetical protein
LQGFIPVFEEVEEKLEDHWRASWAEFLG